MTLFLPKNLYIRTKHSFMTPFFSQFVLCHASNNTSSRNIGGTDAWAVPPPQILWGTTPVPPKSPPLDVLYLHDSDICIPKHKLQNTAQTPHSYTSHPCKRNIASDVDVIDPSTAE